MLDRFTSHNWSRELGLVEASLLAQAKDEFGHHVVLLDGSSGSFVLSESLSADFRETTAANWSWSADLPHHVHLGPDTVTVLRWDSPSVRRFARAGVEAKLEAFYEYLFRDRVQSRPNAVDHSIDVFRRLRSYMNEEDIPDEASIPTFLFVIASMMSGGADVAVSQSERIAQQFGLNNDYLDIFRRLGYDTLNSLIEQFRFPRGMPRALEIIPDILVRHAGGTIFQEAHFEFVRGGPIDMFGLPSLAVVRANSRGGTHFTPPGLARSLIEQVFRHVDLTKPTIRILDPACGAGSFLRESLRYLQRVNYTGEVSLFGYDVSANAVEMTKFVLRCAISDWPEIRTDRIEFIVQDSVEQDFKWPAVDVVLMNPPFISWGGLSEDQRGQLKAILRNYYAGRPDYSMGFIQKAIDSLQSNGVLGSLLPASLLSLEASLKWRRSLLESCSVEFLGLLGDHTLFRHAIVEVAASVFVKNTTTPSEVYLSLWSSERPGASSEVLRSLRQYQIGRPALYIPSGTIIKSTEDWRVSVSEKLVLNDTPDWRPRPSRLDAVMPILRTGTDTVIDNVFHVREGIRAGLRKAFILTERELQILPRNERLYFRPIAENKNIREGRINAHDYIFYPDAVGLDPILSEEDLSQRLPKYFKNYLAPNRQELSSRSALRGRNWWVLNWGRNYFVSREAKLVSAFFGKTGSFALDLEGDYVVVQGFAWFPRSEFTQEIELTPAKFQNDYLAKVYNAYVALLNSRIFLLLLAEFCPHVAGGQFNLSKRFVGHIPLPNLAKLGRQSSHFGFMVEALSEEGLRISTGRNTYSRRTEELVSEVYRVPVSLWPNVEI